MLGASISPDFHADRRIFLVGRTIKDAGGLALKAQIFKGSFGDAITNEFGIKPEALTAAEAGYLTGFRDADSVRNRIATARQERLERLRSKGVQEGIALLYEVGRPRMRRRRKTRRSDADQS